MKAIWDTPVLKGRLKRRLGIGKTQFYFVMSGERPCLVQRFCDLIDDALVIDRTGRKALKLAEYPLRYLRSLMQEQATEDPAWDNHAAADELLAEVTKAITKLNSLDLNALRPGALEEARTSLTDVEQIVRQTIGRVDAEERRRRSTAGNWCQR
jgi:hypothetical protein